MAKYTVTATFTRTYEIEVEANDPLLAIKSLEGWIDEDFEEFEVGTSWNMEAN